MAFADKAKEYLDAGVRVSKDVLNKAGDAVQEISDKGVLKLEISRLKAAQKKEYEKLGIAVSDALSVRETKSVTAKTAGVSTVLDEIARLKEQIESKTQEYETITRDSLSDVKKH